MSGPTDYRTKLRWPWRGPGSVLPRALGNTEILTRRDGQRSRQQPWQLILQKHFSASYCTFWLTQQTVLWALGLLPAVPAPQQQSQHRRTTVQCTRINQMGGGVSEGGHLIVSADCCSGIGIHSPGSPAELPQASTNLLGRILQLNLPQGLVGATCQLDAAWVSGSGDGP